MNVLRFLLPLTFISFIAATPEGGKKARTISYSFDYKSKLVNQGASWVSRKAQEAGLTVEQRSAKIVAAKLAMGTPVVQQVTK